MASLRYRRPPGMVIEPLRGLADHRAREGFFGVAVTPKKSEPRLIDPDTALVLYSLEEPGSLPAFAALDLLADHNRELFALIGANLIEVELNDNFVTGNAALGELVPLAATDTPVAALNRRVMLHALRIARPSPSAMREHLYFANAEPMSPRWVERLSKGTDHWLGLDATPTLGDWRIAPSDSWTYMRPGSTRSGSSSGWKLYFSPTAEALVDVLPLVAETFSQCRAAQWKVGRHPQGLLRPDKIVGYFSSRDDLAAAADRFATKFADITAHGVPFAVPAEPTGLVSWGADPRPTPGAEPMSWRFAFCELMAEWLLMTDAAEVGENRVDQALRLCAADGFDPVSFEPSAAWLRDAKVTI